MPFVVISFMSIFPLVFLEFLMFGIFIIATLSIPLIFDFAFIPQTINALAIPWFMFIVAIVGLVASISQLYASKTIFLQASTDHLRMIPI